MVSHDAKIIIVGGGGTMGSSTALHFARRGYTNIRILDMFQSPSAQSAGNDMNKLISTQYVDGIWGRLALEAWDAWKTDSLFSPFLHATGRIDVASRNNPDRKKKLIQQCKRNESIGRGHNMTWLETEEELVQKASYLSGGDIAGWKGAWIEDAGWVAARDALGAVAGELNRRGVKSVFGTAGTFESLLLADDGTTCRGVKTIDGTEWEGDLVVLATGAWSPTLLDLEGQCVSKCWQYGHIQLSPEETKELRNSPTLYNSELGFFMEPSDQGVMKFVDEFEGYIHLQPCRPFGAEKEEMMSVPRSHALHPTDTIPTKGENAIKQLIATCFPQFADRPLFKKAVCWVTDSFDGNWLLCEDPRYTGLFLATGDSGHTFKMLPIVGKYVVDLVEGKLSVKDKELWRWRPELKSSSSDTCGRNGPQPQDLSELTGWRHDLPVVTSMKGVLTDPSL